MSLLSTYTSANMETTALLAIRYAVEFVEDGYMYRTTRTATKSYSYIGMTRSAAESCRLAKIAQYTRVYARMDSLNTRTVGTKTLPGIEEVTECAAEVTAKQDHDDSWRCDIVVKETDIYTSENPADVPADLFTTWTATRTYDETTLESIFNIASAEVVTTAGSGSTFVTLTVLEDYIDDWDLDNVTLYYKLSSSATEWTQAAISLRIPAYNRLRTESDGTVGTLWMARFSPYTSSVKASVAST